MKLLLLGALLPTALLFSQTSPSPDPQIRNGQLYWFTLSESPEQLTAALGKPVMVSDFAQDFRSWQYQLGEIDRHEYSHQIVFRKSDNSIVSIARNYEPERVVDGLSPASETSVHQMMNGGKPQYSVLVRRLSPNVVLLGMGISAPGQKTGQLVLIRQSELRNFYPWLFDQLQAKK